MSDLVARTGRHQQRYEDGFRLVAGYISQFLLLFFSSVLYLIELPCNIWDLFWIFVFYLFGWWEICHFPLEAAMYTCIYICMKVTFSVEKLHDGFLTG